MKTIQFHIPTGMLAAVLEGRKTQTVRSLSNLNTYAVGEVLAVVEPYYRDGDEGDGSCYWFIYEEDYKYYCENQDKIPDGHLFSDMNRFFLGNPDKFPADEARNFIRITGISVKVPTEFTDAEFEAEGIEILYGQPRIRTENFLARHYTYSIPEVHDSFTYSFAESFQSLLQAIYGEERGSGLFHSQMVVLTFERCAREGGAL